MIYKLSGGLGAVLLKCLHETPAGILVDGRVLEKLLSDHLGVQTGRQNKISHQPGSAVQDDPSFHRA